MRNAWQRTARTKPLNYRDIRSIGNHQKYLKAKAIQRAIELQEGGKRSDAATILKELYQHDPDPAHYINRLLINLRLSGRALEANDLIDDMPDDLKQNQFVQRAISDHYAHSRTARAARGRDMTPGAGVRKLKRTA